MDDLISKRSATERMIIAKTLLESVLEDMPTAEKRGKWIKDRLSSTCGGSYGVYRCSECDSCYQDIGYVWNFCPICGARMEESE